MAVMELLLVFTRKGGGGAHEVACFFVGAFLFGMGGRGCFV